MDPNACLRQILESTDREEMHEHCTDLHEWLKSGGFRPTMSPKQFYAACAHDLDVKYGIKPCRRSSEPFAGYSYTLTVEHVPWLALDRVVMHVWTHPSGDLACTYIFSDR